MTALDKSQYVHEIIIPCSDMYRAYIKKNILAHSAIQKKVIFVSGGKERVHSVHNAIRKVSSSATHILVQDAVRPFLQTATIMHLVRALGKADGVIAARLVVPTLKEVKGKRILSTVDRNSVVGSRNPSNFLRKKCLQVHFEK